MNKINLFSILSFFLTFLLSSSIYSQVTLNGNKVTLSDNHVEILKSKFNNFDVYSLIIPNNTFDSNTKKVSLNLGSKYLWNMDLEKNDLKADGYESYITTEKGIKQSSVDIILYKGVLSNNDSNFIRLSYRDNSLRGYIVIDGEYYLISPLRKIIEQIDSEYYIVYKEENVLDNSLLLNDEVVVSSFITNDLKSLNYSNSVKLLRIATDADYEFYTSHGSDTNADILEIINLVEGIYESSFNVTFEVVYQNYYTDANDPYTIAFSDSTYSAFLAEFRSYWNANHSSVYRDVAHLFTGKSRAGVAGVGYSPGIYPNSTVGYSCTSDGPLMHKIMGHELGHNFNGKHADGENCDLITASIMCPKLKMGTPYFSSNSISTIGSYI